METDREKPQMIGGPSTNDRDDVLEVVYETEVTAPSAVGFHENVAAVGRWSTSLTARVQTFLSGLAAGERRPAIRPR
jgi:hypothetical protein